MSIAQRMVAGEGGVCLVSAENVNASDISSTEEVSDAAALTAFRTDETNLPWTVFRAAHRASHVDTLSQRARSLFAALARTVDASRPYASIFASRAVLHDRALQSRRTLYRALGDLESAGLVRRAGQLRIVTEGYEGRFGRTYLHLTEKAAILLGLAEPPKPITEDAAWSTGQASEEEGAAAPTRAFNLPSASLAHGAYIGDLSPASSQKRQPGQVPADLQRLRPLGFRDFLIFKLMGQAREMGQRLSDVVEATWTDLKKAHHPINYLQALLRNPRDFGHQIRTRNAARSAQADAVAERDAADALVRDFAGQSFVDETGTRKLVLDTESTTLTIYTIEEGVARQDAGDWKLRLAQAVRTGRLRVASHADLEAFAQARQIQSAKMGRASSAGQSAPEKQKVSTQARDRIAELKNLLRPYGRALA